MEITGENIRKIIDKSYDAGVTDTVVDILPHVNEGDS